MTWSVRSMMCLLDVTGSFRLRCLTFDIMAISAMVEILFIPTSAVHPAKNKKLDLPTVPNLQHSVTVNNDTAFVAVRRRRVHCNKML